MEIILNAAQAKAVDTYSIEHKKIPSIGINGKSSAICDGQDC